jgi:hypothetical protein
MAETLSMFAGTQDADGWQLEPKLMQAPDLYSRTGERKLMRPGWRWYAMRALDDGSTLVQGDVPIRIKRTGRPVWPKGEGQSIVVTDADLAETRDAWERECWSCAGCGGDGREYAGWSTAKGYRYRTCTRCKGSGSPPSPSREPTTPTTETT